MARNIASARSPRRKREIKSVFRDVPEVLRIDRLRFTKGQAFTRKDEAEQAAKGLRAKGIPTRRRKFGRFHVLFSTRDPLLTRPKAVRPRARDL